MPLQETTGAGVQGQENAVYGARLVIAIIIFMCITYAYYEFPMVDFHQLKAENEALKSTIVSQAEEIRVLKMHAGKEGGYVAPQHTQMPSPQQMMAMFQQQMMVMFQQQMQDAYKQSHQ